MRLVPEGASLLSHTAPPLFAARGSKPACGVPAAVHPVTQSTRSAPGGLQPSYAARQGVPRNSSRGTRHIAHSSQVCVCSTAPHTHTHTHTHTRDTHTLPVSPPAARRAIARQVSPGQRRRRWRSTSTRCGTAASQRSGQARRWLAGSSAWARPQAPLPSVRVPADPSQLSRSQAADWRGAMCSGVGL